MPTNRLKTLIVGCGNIAGAFDFGYEGLPSTHARAYINNEKFDLTACVDTDSVRLNKFISNFPIRYSFSNLEDVKNSNLDFDVISICTPTFCHYSDVIKALELNPKLIFCEKPLASSYEDAAKINSLCKSAGVLLAVNHTRRWDPEILELKNNISTGTYGEIRSVVGYYNKGILNNGSHMIDILLNLFGPLNISASTTAVYDFFKDDPSLTALLHTNSDVPIHLVAAHASDYSLFELEIIGSNKILIMRDGGLNWSSRDVVVNSRFKGYKSLDKDKYFKGKYLDSMTLAVDNIYDAITKGKKLLCTGSEACEAHKICFDLMRMAMTNSKSK